MIDPFIFFSDFIGSFADVNHGHTECHYSVTIAPGGLCEGVNFQKKGLQMLKFVIIFGLLQTYTFLCLQAIDIWTFVGLFFVVISLVEGIFIGQGSKESERQQENCRNVQRTLHKLSRVAFPVCFLLFVLLYWLCLKYF